MQIGLGFAFAYPQLSTSENYSVSFLMYFLFLETFVRLLLYCSIPFDENQVHFYHIFALAFIKPFTSFFPFVSNGDSLDWRGLNCEQMLERIIPLTTQESRLSSKQSGQKFSFENP